MQSLVLLRNDLRLDDNPAMKHAFIQSELIHVLYFYSKKQLKLHNESDLKISFLIENLRDLAISLDELNVPIYPQDRFQLAVARHIAHKYQLGDGIEIHLLGIADRFTGQRSSQVLRGVQEIDMYCRQYFFSATPTYLNR